jgi:hypothetical protein
MRVALMVTATLAGSLIGAGAVRAQVKARLTDLEVREAVMWGRNARLSELQQYPITVAPTWTLNFDTPFLRVAQLSNQWKQRGRTISERDVPPGVLQTGVNLYALAIQQPNTTEAAKSIRHVTIRRPGGLEVVQPSSVRTNVTRARMRNDFRPAGIAQSVHAVFAPQDLAVGNQIRIEFRDGGYDSVTLTREMLAHVR